MKKIAIIASCISLCMLMLTGCKSKAQRTADSLKRTLDNLEQSMTPCHTTPEHIRAIYNYDFDHDQVISGSELEAFFINHPRAYYDQAFIDWMGKNTTK